MKRSNDSQTLEWWVMDCPSGSSASNCSTPHSDTKVQTPRGSSSSVTQALRGKNVLSGWATMDTAEDLPVEWEFWIIAEGACPPAITIPIAKRTLH